MIGDRRLRARRRGLTPRKVIFVYFLAFFMVAFHQTSRVADWFDDFGLSHEGWFSESAFKASAFLSGHVATFGPNQLNRVEDKLLALADRDQAGFRSSHYVSGDPAHSPPPLPSIARIPDPDPDGDLFTKKTPPSPSTADDFHDQVLSGEIMLAPMLTPQEMASLPPIVQPRVNAEGIFNPSNVLLLGDSMMLEGLGPQLQRELQKHANLTVNRAGRYGTGLCRLDVFDWLSYFEEMLLKYEPELVILTVGANDTQDIVDEGKKRIFLGSDKWKEIYAGRAAELLEIAAQRGVRVIWIGLPVMGRQPYGDRVAGINKITAEMCKAASNCRFWDSWLSVAGPGGQYATFLSSGKRGSKSIRVRAKDGIHLTESGGHIMTEKFLKDTESWVDYKQPRPGLRPAAPQPALQQPNAAIRLKPDYPAEPAPLPLAPSAGDEPEESGQVSVRKLPSQIRGWDVPYVLAEPAPSSSVNKGPFPVIILLHGAWGSAESWLETLGQKKLEELATKHQVILAMPDGEEAGWYLDGPKAAVKSYMEKEFIPHIKSLPQVDGQRMAICGISMGGHGALTLALANPGLFQAVGTLSGVTDLTVHAGDAHPVDKSLFIGDVIGSPGLGARKWRRYSAHYMTKNNPQVLEGVSLIISFGSDDKLIRAENRAYHNLLKKFGLAHEYYESPGAHDWQYWTRALPRQLEFLSKALYETKEVPQ